MEKYNCCSSPSLIKSDFKSFELTDSQKVELSTLMWCLPETPSEKARKGTEFCNSIYDEKFVELLKCKFQLNDDDFNLVEESAINCGIGSNIIQFYETQFCINCEKIFFVKTSERNTTIVCFFRHIRNIIAHGRFFIKNNYFVGLDENKGKTTCIISIKYSKLIMGLNELISFDGVRVLLKESLIKVGYNIIETQNSLLVDLVAKKNSITFNLTFKNFKGRYIKQIDVETFINKRSKQENAIDVLVVDSTYVTSKINKYVYDKNVAILDKKFVKDMFDGRDVLEEIADAIYKNANY